MNKWLWKFRRIPRLDIALIGDRKSLGGSFLRNLLGEDSKMLRTTVTEEEKEDDSCKAMSRNVVVTGVRVSVKLVPALSDAEGYKNESYFRSSAVASADLVIYCVDMSETRLRGSVLRTFRELKPNWSRTVIVLTFADALPALVRDQGKPDFPKCDYFNDKLAEWTRELKALLERIGVQQEVVAKIQFYPCANGPGDLLPNEEPWLPPLSLAIMEILSPEKKAAFLKEHPTLFPSPTVTEVLPLKKKAKVLEDGACMPSVTACTTAEQPTVLLPTFAAAAGGLPVAVHVSTMTEVQSSSKRNLEASTDSPVLTRHQSQSIREALSKLRKDCPVFGILVIGRTGVGKSTLINNLLGKEVASVGHTLHSETPEVNPHEVTVEGVPIVVYDSPGLGDVKGEEEEKKHLEIIKALLARKKIHLVVYCFQMNDTSMTSSVVGALCKYHQIGVDWKRSIIALTFADALYPSKMDNPDLPLDVIHLLKQMGKQSSCFEKSRFFDSRLASCQKDLRVKLVSNVGVKSDVVERVKICPTSLLPSDQLPNGNRWYTPLWLHIVEILSPAATVRFLDIHRRNISDKQSPPPSQCHKVDVNLSTEESQNRLTIKFAAIFEEAGMESSKKAAILAAIQETETRIRTICNLLHSPSEQLLPPPDAPGSSTG